MPAQVRCNLCPGKCTLQSPLLLAGRLLLGLQFAQTGWGNLQSISKITGFFASLDIPFPSISSHFVSGQELAGGILLILGLGSWLIGPLLAVNMLVAIGPRVMRSCHRSSPIAVSSTLPTHIPFSLRH